MPRVVAHIQARMGSERLPGKVLADVAGRPAESRLLERLRACRLLDGVILATSDAPGDDPLEAWAAAEGVPCHRGSEHDLLSRVVDAQRAMEAEVIVPVTGDCILIDPEIVDMGIETYLANDCDIVSNVWRPSYPQGVDVQVYRLELLEQLERTTTDPAYREHVSLHFYEHPDELDIVHLIAPARWHGPDLRFQLDYPEDLEFIRQVYARLEPEHGNNFGLEEVMALLRAEPALGEINAHCVEKPLR
jgi:spore coat polysaccharide biosynthesis protein SpsF